MASKKKRKQEPTFTVNFKDGALTKLKELAQALEIPDDQLGEVLVKGVKVIELAQGGKLIIEKNTERLEVDLKKI